MNNPIYYIEENKRILKVLDKSLEIKEYKNLNLEILKKFYINYKWYISKEIRVNDSLNMKTFFLYPYTIGYWYPKTNIAQLLEIAKLWNEKYCKYVYFTFLKKALLEIAINYDFIAFVPPSINRKCNILTLAKKDLKFLWKKIIYTYKKWVWPQIKNIKDIKEKKRIADIKFWVWKIENIKDNPKILIIDDVVNTGASMLSIAEKIKKKAPNSIIEGFALIWSLSNDLIKEI